MNLQMNDVDNMQAIHRQHRHTDIQWQNSRICK